MEINMTSELINTFTPKNELGDNDFRYESDLHNIFDTIRPEVLKGLEEFKQKTTELEIKYGSLALEFAIKWFDYTDKLSPDDTYNQYNYRAKCLSKQLSEGLKERGFKPSNVTKLIAAAKFQKRLRAGLFKGRKNGVNQRIAKIYEFVLTLPISSQYLLAGMTDQGITKAMRYEKDNKQWDSKTDTFIGKPLTVRALEELKKQYPINIEENRGRKKNPLSQLERVPDNQEAITIESTEIKEVTQESIAKDIVSLVKQLDTSPEVWKDQEIISILREAKRELMSIAHLALQPTKELTPN